MTKLKDIAAAAGVSISTVSKALNDSHEIKESTRTKIVRIARELNYRMTPHQKKVVNRNKQMIGVICPEVSSVYYTQLISSIGQQIAQRGFNYTFAVTDFLAEKEIESIQVFASQQVDGIILITENNRIQFLLEGLKEIWNIPLVLITMENKIDHYDSVWIDDYYGATLGINHLINLGHRSIGFIGDQLTLNRYKAFCDVMAQHKLPVEERFVQISRQRFEECGYNSMKAIFKEEGFPSAIFAAYDHIAIGAMRAISERGLSIPEDISIIGIDNVPIVNYLTNALTTISNPIKEMAVVTVSILFRKIVDEQFTVVQNVALKPVLVKRETTRKYRQTT